jgi:hypothetical protein
MRDKGTTFFDAKRNIKSCEKPTPNIGDYLVLEDNNCFRTADHVSLTAATTAVRGEDKHPPSAAKRKASRSSGAPAAHASRGSTCPCHPCHCASSSLSLSLSRQQQERQWQEEEQEDEEYECIIRELEAKVSQRVTMEAQLKVLRFMQRAESRN